MTVAQSLPQPLVVSATPSSSRLRALRREPAVLLGGGALVIFGLVALLAPWLAPHDIYASSGPRLSPPSAGHLLGTDALGRDVLSRVLHGARLSLPAAAIVIVSAVLIGGFFGTAAGYFGGIVDSAIMRLADVTSAFPPILLAMAVAASLGPGLRNGCIAMIVVWWPIYARITRVQVMSVRRREHVEAAVSIGAKRSRIVRKHILPLSFTPALVSASMDFGQVVLLTASLSFLGLGASPPDPEWGAMITEGARNFYQWWIAAGPGLAILLVVLAANYLGDGLRDFFDPKRARR